MNESPSELRLTAERAVRGGAAVLGRYFGQPELDVRLKAENDLVSEADRESERVVVALLQEEHPSHQILAEEGSASGPGSSSAGSTHQWIIDPLDGTSNFVHGLPIFCVSVACLRTGDDGDELVAAAICDPARGEMFSAALGEGATRNGMPIRVRQGPPAGAGGQAPDPLAEAFLATGFPFRANRALDAYLSMFREAFLAARGIRRCGAAALDLAHVASGIYHGFFELGLSPWDVAAGALLIREAGGEVSDLDGEDGFLASGNIVAGTPGVHAALLERFAPILGEPEARELLSGAPLTEASV